MNIERAAMKSKLSGLQDDKKNLIMRAEIVHENIRRELNTALIAVEDTDMARIGSLYGDLLDVHTQIVRINAAIYKLNREMGD